MYFVTFMQVYDSLSSGSWSFETRAQDAAGNLGGLAPTLNWTLALGVYAQMGASIPALVKSYDCSLPPSCIDYNTNTHHDNLFYWAEAL